MHLSSFTDFGLRALILLAEADGSLLTSAAVADHLDVSRHHMAKVLQCLSASGFVESQRGPRGGVRLAHHPGTIRIGDVVRALEGAKPLVQCRGKGGDACRLLPVCRLPRALGRAQASFLRELDAVSLAECIGSGGPMV